MAVKVGDKFISLFVDKDGSFSWEDHIVRTIRGGWIYAIHKNICTWGKLSKRQGDFGWLPTFHPMFRTRWRVGSERPEELAATRLQAVRYAIELHVKYTDADDFNTPEIYEKVLPRLKKLEAKYSKRKK